MRYWLLIACAAAALTACGGSRMVMTGGSLRASPRAIVTTSNKPEVADALAAEVRARGYSILDAHQTSDLIYAITGRPLSQGMVNTLQESDILSELKARKVDAILAVDVKTVAAIYGGELLDVIALSVYGTDAIGGSQAGLEWHNAWGGMPGSPADHTMRKPLPAAVAEVAPALAGLLGAPGPAVNVDVSPSEEEIARRRRRRRRREEEDEDAAAPPPQIAGSQPAVPAPAAAQPAGAAQPAAQVPELEEKPRVVAASSPDEAAAELLP